MITRKGLLAPLKAASCQIRCLHSSIKPPPVPSPTPFIPDVPSFLTVIGRGLSAHANKFDSWAALFSLTGAQLREKGIEPPRARRYLLRWREKFRLGFYGVGGNLKHVKDGVAELRVIEAALPIDWKSETDKMATVTSSANTRKIVVNVPPGTQLENLDEQDLVPAPGFTVRGAHTISGPHVEPLKGTEGWGAILRVKEGLWEHKRGHKIDGGERRRKEVRAKRRAEENKKAR